MHLLLQLKQLWEQQGWLGERATRFGSPDCVLLHSGGPATHLSTFSLLWAIENSSDYTATRN